MDETQESPEIPSRTLCLMVKIIRSQQQSHTFGNIKALYALGMNFQVIPSDKETDQPRN